MRPHAERGAPAGDDDETDAIGQIVEEVRDQIRHGQVADDVSHVLEGRLGEAGLHLRPEQIDDLAEDIENDVSM